MLAGAVDLSSPVIFWQSRVKINGHVVDHLEWDVERVMCHVPGDTDASGRSADASVKPAPADPVVTITGSPWQPVAGWPPRQGQSITIEVSQDGVTWFPIITGLADKPSGTLTGEMSVDIVEKVDRFSKAFAFPPLQWRMHPNAPGGAMMDTDLNHQWFINRAMEVAGFWSTMLPVGEPVLRVSMQGSRNPEIGDLVSASVKGAGDDLGLSRAYCKWGNACCNFTAVYDLRTPISGAADLRVMVPQGQIRADGTVSHGGFSVRLTGPTGNIGYLSINVTDRTASLTTSAGRACNIGGITDIVGLRRSGTTWTLYSETETDSGTGGPESDDRITRVTVDADAFAAVGAIQVQPAVGAFPSVVFDPTGIIQGGAANITQLEASPALDGSSAELMDAIGNATLSHWGFDEQGRAVFVPILGRLGLSPVRTIHDDTDIIDDVTWAQDWQAAASVVHLDLKVPQRRWATLPSIQLWDSGGGSLSPGETAVDLIHPDTDVDWIGVDTGHLLSGGESADKIWNGSIFVGLIDLPDAGAGPDDRAAYSTEYSGSVQFVDWVTYTINRTAKSSLQVSETTGDSWKWLPKSLRKRSTPIVRGYQKTTWVDATIETADNGSDAPVYVHDCTYWAGSNGSLTAQWLANLLQVDRVTLSELEIRPDPRLQLGDIVNLNLSSAGVTVTGMITGKHLSFSDGVLSMRITVLLTASNVDRVTWAAFEDYMSGRTYAQLEAAAAGKTYGMFEADPLHIMGGN